MPELIKSDALILHAIRWHESSKIVTLYSREWGKIGVIARGALKPKSPFTGSIETLNFVRCTVSMKTGRDLQILTELDVADSYSGLRLKLERLPYALAITELLNLVLHEHEADAIFFDFTTTMLKNIETAENPDIIFWYFLLKFSSFLGFRPQLKHCHICHSEPSSGSVRFNLPQGTIFCADCASNTVGGMKLEHHHWQFLKHLQTYPYKKIQDFSFDNADGFNFTPLLLEYMNFHTEKNVVLKSLQLLIP